MLECWNTGVRATGIKDALELRNIGMSKRWNIGIVEDWSLKHQNIIPIFQHSRVL
jgi:hypothetical protein